MTERAGLRSVMQSVALGIICMASIQCGSDDDDGGGNAGAGGSQSQGGEGGGGTASGGAAGGEPGAAAGSGGQGGAGELAHHLYVGCRDAEGSIQHYRISSDSGAVTLGETAHANATTSN